MRFLVTGVGGQLGHDVLNELDKRGYEAVGTDILDEVQSPFPYVKLDITDESAVSKAIGMIKPDVVVHCAAWTAVDAAEDEENRDKVTAINSNGTRYIAQAARIADAKMIFCKNAMFSTPPIFFHFIDNILDQYVFFHPVVSSLPG